MLKSEVRERIKRLKLMLDEAEKVSAAQSVFDRLEANAAFQLAEKILLYHSLPDELDTRSFLRKWKDRKRFFLPRVNGVNLELLPYDESRLEIGSFHIEEPKGDELHPVEEMELIIVPGVAFDKKGRRLGRGKGFYDRLLADSKATKIGIAYEFQLMDELPSEEHDIPMDFVITESTTIVIKR
ncbi:MAG: 5-formyltetrahydrofolate cyclo-ligase [Muribaculaceae bacterium]|nr:5-formyltetrahydrofolate cyclo-ligase [Muribaculaceae bacterium]